MHEAICNINVKKEYKTKKLPTYIEIYNHFIRNEVIHIHSPCTLLVKFTFNENRLSFVLEAKIFRNCLLMYEKKWHVRNNQFVYT